MFCRPCSLRACESVGHDQAATARTRIRVPFAGTIAGYHVVNMLRSQPSSV